MKLCHLEQRDSCFQYCSQGSSIEIIELKAGENIQVNSKSSQLIFIIKGVLDIICKKDQKTVYEEETILIPLHTPSVVTAIKDASMLVMKLDLTITFCDRLPLELFLETHENIEKDAYIGLLEPNQRLTNFADTMQKYIHDELNCTSFFQAKIQEFLFLIRAYYDKQIVFNFFKSICTQDFIFSSNVYRNLDQVKTIEEMADKLHYSPSGFEKKFKKVFNIPPHRWMQEQKASKIYHEIHCSKKTFAEIAFEYDFSSPSHFNAFCKLFFGQTPGKLRKERVERSKSLFM